MVMIPLFICCWSLVTPAGACFWNAFVMIAEEVIALRPYSGTPGGTFVPFVSVRM